MPRGALPALAELDVADAPETWTRLGFSVRDDAVALADVVVRLRGVGAGAGILGWTLRAAAPLPASLDGIVTSGAAPGAAKPAHAEHPNGATGLDHVVVRTPDLRRTLAALEGIGMDVRRTREAGPPERRMRQAFLWAGEVVLEVVGPLEPHGDGPARLWGLVVVTPALEELPARTDWAVGKLRPAVQEGRRIATVRQEAGSTVPLAFMTPHVSRRTPHQEREPPA